MLCKWHYFTLLHTEYIYRENIQSNIPLYKYTTSLSLSSVNVHLGCFPIVAIINSAAMNTAIHISFQLWFSPDVCPGVGMQDHMEVLFFKEPPYCSP